MRLSELHPEWLFDERTRGRIGLTFECQEHNGRGHRVYVWFSNPPDGDAAITANPPRLQPVGHRGDDFETLTVFATIRDGDVYFHIHDGYVSSS